MTKIAFIGAGSVSFANRLMLDLLSFESLRDSEFTFMDIDKERLADIKILANAYLDKMGIDKKPVFTTSRKKALEGADFIINLVKIGCNETAFMDLDVPKKFGLKQTIGDTCCVAGVFRGLRTMVFLEDLVKDIKEVAGPRPVILNYTNPQSMLVMAMSRITDIPFIGLCHSVQGTTKRIADYLKVPYEELVYEAAGINHMNWVMKLERNGKDLYPRLRRLIKNRGIYDQKQKEDDPTDPFLGPARLDMLNRVGYVVTESSIHFPEYVPYYARTDKLIKKYDIPIDQHKVYMKQKIERHGKLMEDVRKGNLPEVSLSREYGSRIIHAMVSNEPCRVYANVMNDGLVTNLPEWSAVEVVSLVDANGVQPCHFGALPTQLAALCRMDINVHQLAVEAFLERDIRKVAWALMMDPLTHSRLTIDETEEVVDLLVSKQQKYLRRAFRKRK